MGNHPTNL